MKNLKLSPIKGAFLVLIILFVLSLFHPLLLAGDFDFYATDLISKQSYRRISMDFKDANIKNILKVFSEQAGLNFIASQVVQDRLVTLYLNNVPLQEALNKIMSANNLTYELEPGSNIFIVKEWGKPEVETITKVYYMQYTRFKASKLQQVINRGPTAGTISGGGGGGGATGGGTSGAGGGGTGASSGDVGIEASIKAVLTSNGKLVADDRTNSLIITDIPSQFEVIERIIALLDVPTPQVMIEVEMLDVSKRTIDQLGVDTGAGTHIMQITGASRQTRFPNFFADGLSLSNPSFTYGTLSAAVFSAVLDFLTADTKTKFLARPRILTLSNESAEIKITTNEAIGLKTETASSEGTATTTQEAERFETGVSLKVTPQVDATNGLVTMFIEPVVAQTKTGGTFGSQTFKDPEIRSSATTLRIKNGETIVVGGLIRTNEDTTIKKMPIIGDVPIVGALFRHKSRSVEERELIVFITPHIVGFDNVVALAKSDASLPSNMPHREQTSAVLRKEEVDNTLERWEN